jgi:hypothetical protein
MSESLLASPVRATDRDALDWLASLLHDETCEVDAIAFSVEEQRLTLPFRRQFHDGPERPILIEPERTVIEKPWMRSRLTLHRVEGWEKRDDPEIGDYSFNDWSYTRGVLTIYFAESLTIIVAMRGIDVLLEDIGFDGYARIERYSSGSEASSHAVYNSHTSEDGAAA